jgi:flagellar biosynthesis chaperone FliJ
MDDLKDLQTEHLIDMLATYTANYTKMISDGATAHDFAHYERVISLIQKEIRFRKSSLSSDTISFTSDSTE